MNILWDLNPDNPFFKAFLIVGGTAFLAQFCWLMTALIVIVRYRPQKTVSVVPVSVIVAARNEAENLIKLIPALLHQNHPDFEVIIVLDRCSDESLDLVKKWEKDDLRIQCVLIDHLPNHFSPKKYALTLGIKKAKHEWLLFTDADCLPAGDEWISEMSGLMTPEHDMVLGFGPYHENILKLNKFIQFETLMTAMDYAALNLLGFPYMGVGRNLAYRKSLFLAALGFNKYQHVQGGDDDLFVQYQGLKGKVACCFEPKSLMYSEGKTNWADYWLQKKRHFQVGKFYKTGFKAFQLVKSLILVIPWICLFLAPFFKNSVFIVSISFILLFIVKALIHRTVAHKIGQGYHYLFLPILELFYIIFVPIAAILSFFSKKIKWK